MLQRRYNTLVRSHTSRPTVAYHQRRIEIMLKLFEKEYKNYESPIDFFNSNIRVRFDLALVSYQNFEGSDRHVVRCWRGLRLEQMTMRSWYFRRIAAMEQIANPRKIYGFECIRTVERREDVHRKLVDLKNKIANLKGRITKIQSEWSRIVSGWNELFPIESDPRYAKTMNAINQKTDRLKSLEFEYRTLKGSIKTPDTHLHPASTPL